MADSKLSQFHNLLQMLKSEITSNGISKSLEDDFREAKGKLHEVKAEYFKNKIIFCELKNVLCEYREKKKENKISREEEKVCSMLEDALATSDARQYLRLSRTSTDDGCNLFGLSDDEMKLKHRRKHETQQIFQQYFISEIEQRLKKQCINLIRFWDSRREEESDGLALAKANKLPNLIEKEIRKVADEEEMLQNENTDNQKLIMQHEQVVGSSFETVEQSMKSHSLKANLENTKVTVKWLATKCDAVQQKIRVLQCQLIKDTYNQETIIALQKVKRLLDAALLESKSELTRLKETLQIYESVGPAFESLVKQYVQLTAEIDNKKWALSELKRTQSLESPR